MNFVKLTLVRVGGLWQYSAVIPNDAPTKDVIFTTSTGVEAIARERGRQQDSEGFDILRDAQYVKGELADAARSYATRAVYLVHLIAKGVMQRPNKRPPAGWPWDHDWWKPDNEDPIPNLIKAGALIAAEIDRLTVERESGVEPAKPVKPVEEAAAAA